jgi:DNA-binding transcriptional MerR regulator
MTTAGSQSDPLSVLREYRQLAPWNLHDLAQVASAILDASSIRPINAAARAHPNQRTIRFYVTRGLVTPPDGRGTAATYTYRHLLQVLGIKLRQMEGATLAEITVELGQTTGDVLERRVAAALGPTLPRPTLLPVGDPDRPALGRAGRVLQNRLTAGSPRDLAEEPTAAVRSTWHRIPISQGIELHVKVDHPFARLASHQAQLAEAVRLAIGPIVSRSSKSHADVESGFGRNALPRPQD